MRVLVSGAGVAGPCLAFWLERHGFDVTIVERAPRLRTGGYVIDFWGAGFDVADRMGLAGEILEKGYKVREVRLVDRHGKRVSGLAVSAFERQTRGRYTSVPRSELAGAIYRALPGRVETIFDDSIVGLEDSGREVRVQFARAQARPFDIVVGADGLHSQVRRLTFGDEASFERYLGMKVAAFQTEGYRPKDELVYMLHREVGLQVGRFTMRGDRTMFLFVFGDSSPSIPPELDEQKRLLRQTFSGAGWESVAILEALDSCEELYLDRVSQIRMPRWTKGRVALIGDAAFCPSLLAGQGTALAMTAAYIMAGELKAASGDPDTAFRRYEERLRAFIAAKQESALKLMSFFVPRSRLSIIIGDQIMRLMSIHVVADLAVGRQLRDRIALHDY
jgi:2-polyprenyl-6-methoxyphenol hydroxylase-like FAD-dependent oxidoreductase